MKKKKRILFVGIAVITALILMIVRVPKHTAAVDISKEVHHAPVMPSSFTPKDAPLQYNHSKRKVVYLTFDDGPGAYTPQVLSILKQNHIQAAFFLIGSHAQQYPSLVKQELQSGDYIGLHSMSHTYKKLYVQGTFVPEMLETQQIIKGIIGIAPRLARPPYGSMPGLTQQLRNQAVEAHLLVWDWTIDSLDWTYDKKPLDRSVPAIVNNVLSHAVRDREVVLMHDIHPQSVQALPLIIEGLRAKGYDFEVYNEANHFPMNFWHDGRL
ncbi:polysaccharide deacetylase family protein [Ectobacillus ponti]|uniref:Polysaccharide deacetylase n=1 Tax=Ectobacillus ponti TaxID=2961894 RepID=A0AA42BPH5_9BACI|nr:polysaccharide deacetylase family protein [Ectobacillus ponti]MCP8969130.1 polysaccharide deacetylase [Ectobacillus ponti]